MKRNQIFLESKPLEQNKLFFRYMFETNKLTDSIKLFDKLENCLARDVDKGMNSNKFSKLMKPDFFIGIGLQIGSPQEDNIRYWVRGLDKNKIERFAWVICPYNQLNYQVISNLFYKAYNNNLESIPLPEGLEEYHKKMNLV